jgi:uncharacterized membrane protein
MAAPLPLPPDGAPDGPAPLSANAVTALIHLYRAEVGRMTAYQARLDTTTNWAITTSALVAIFALSSDERGHAILLLLMALNYVFLHLEARRFGAYEASRRRVRLLERAFYPAVLAPAASAADARWVERLLASLVEPPFPTVPLLFAVSWRLRRVYLWIYAGVLLAWLRKLGFSFWPPPALGDVLARAAIDSIPGWLVVLAVAALYTWLLGVAARSGRRHPLANPYADGG